MAVRFYLDGRPNKSGDNPIRVSISIPGDRLVTSAGYSINPDKWDEKKQRVKSNRTNAKGETHIVINSRLNEIESVFSKIDAQIDLELIKPEDVNIRETFADNFRRTNRRTKSETSFFEYIDLFMKDVGRVNSWTESVYEKFNALKNHLLKFNPQLTFDSLDVDGLNDLVDYFHSVPVAGKLYKDRDTRVFGMRNSTIRKQLDFLKWFLRWAVQNNHTTQTAFEHFSPKLITPSQKRVVFLEWDELMTVYNFDIPEHKQYLERVRDVFCFCCFTSLRYSDVANLKKSDIKTNHIEITTVKTADTLEIDLNDYSREILSKYKGVDIPEGKALPVVSNQRMNEYLKELGELCGIDEPQTITYYKGNERFDEVYPKYALMTTHTGRRTFISNAIMMGIPPQTVMKWTGHSDYKAMKPYIDIADRAKAKAMQKFNKR